jgi:hypothetical protein
MNHFLPRRLLAVVFSALIGVLAVSSLTSSASAGVLYRQVAWDSFASMTITDDEAWPFSDEVEKFTLGTQAPFYVSAVNPVETRVISRCAGGEVRIDLHMRVELITADWVRVSGTAYLYEGASCTSNDLDGQKSFNFQFSPNVTHRPSPIEVENQAEGGDSARIQLSLTNVGTVR